MKQSIIIHTNKLLPYSETFIKHHIDGLKLFEPVVLYSQKVNGLSVKSETISSAGKSNTKFSEYAFKLGYISPELKRRLSVHKPVLIHSHFGQNGYASVPISKKLKIPNVTTFHGFDVTINNPSLQTVGVLHWLFRKRINQLIKNGDLFIAVSNFIKGKLLDLGFPEDKIIVNYLGVDCEKFYPNLMASKEKAIVCVARHTKYKGIEYLLEAFEIFNRDQPGYKLLLVGDGDLHDTLKNKAEKCAGEVVFTGRLPQEKIIELLQNSSLYVQPSICLPNGHEEALALTIVEAQACGLPCIVFNSGGMPEAILDGKSGFVAEHKNSHDLAEKMRNILKNHEIRDSMAKEARAFVLKSHNHKTQTGKLEEIYQNMLKGEV